ncbi:MAG TPA: leucyl/phenylalanyl-tRNA--protein transferase [Myxococcota bacterium]|nr:leucyl/phenylalanyl-tRNA--protein transferase [Myxococcota bacterium]
MPALDSGRRLPHPRGSRAAREGAIEIGVEDFVAIGGDLSPASLLAAYRAGIFPWPPDEETLLWARPRRRAILERSAVHVPRSLARARRRSALRFTLDAAFSDVIRACAETPRPDQEGTWITPALRAAYVELHRLGIAHSAEAWRGDALVGGVYGVDIDGAFSAESMFRRERDASKLALLHLLDHLAARGLDWIDVQVMSPHLERLGAREIPCAEFLQRLSATRARGLVLFPREPAPA